MTLPRGRDRQGNQGRVGEEAASPPQPGDGEPETGPGALPRGMDISHASPDSRELLPKGA
jgi:hypothetical protein